MDLISLHQVFSRVVDPENFYRVTQAMQSGLETLTMHRLGILVEFHPRNPTGSYDLLLSQQSHSMIAQCLVESFRKQWHAGLCNTPTTTCMPYFELEKKEFTWKNPDDIVLPRIGHLKVRENVPRLLTIMRPAELPAE